MKNLSADAKANIVMLVVWLAVWSLMAFWSHIVREDCHSKGGAYVGSECLKVERLEP